jgi:hypothetical protein
MVSYEDIILLGEERVLVIQEHGEGRCWCGQIWHLVTAGWLLIIRSNFEALNQSGRNLGRSSFFMTGPDNELASIFERLDLSDFLSFGYAASPSRFELRCSRLRFRSMPERGVVICIRRCAAEEVLARQAPDLFKLH